MTAIKQGQATNAADLQKLTAGLNQLNSGLGQIAEETKGLSLGDAGKTDIATNMANLKTDLTTVGTGAESFKELMADPQFQTFLSDSRNAEFKGKYMTALQQMGTNGQLATSGALQAIDKFSTQIDQIATKLNGAVAGAD